MYQKEGRASGLLLLASCCLNSRAPQLPIPLKSSFQRKLESSAFLPCQGAESQLSLGWRFEVMTHSISVFRTFSAYMRVSAVR
jgi:hypothetical protein